MSDTSTEYAVEATFADGSKTVMTARFTSAAKAERDADYYRRVGGFDRIGLAVVQREVTPWRPL